MERTNDQWVGELGGEGAERDGALGDLRDYLLGGLGRSFGSRGGVDEGFVEDVVQETLLKVLGGLGSFEGRSRFTTWAMSIGVRVGFSELRRRHWKDVSLDQVIEGGGVGLGGVVEPGGGPGVVVERQGVIDAMYRVIEGALSEKQRVALLAELNGMPQEEIGRRMGSNRNAVYKLTHDARKRLKAGLEAAGYTVSDIQGVFGW